MASGIYKILNIINNKFYIGSTINFARRKNEHKYKLKNYKGNSIIRNAVKKYGINNFKFIIIEEIDISDMDNESENKYLSFIEQLYIDICKPQYNLRKKDVTRNKGVCSEKQLEHLRRISKLPKVYPKHKEKPLNPNFRYKLVSIFDLNLNFIETIKGIRQTSRKYGISYAFIKKSCESLNKSIHKNGFIFTWENNKDVVFNINKKIDKTTTTSNFHKRKTVLQYDLNDNFIKEWIGIRLLCKELNLDRAAVNRNLRNIIKETKGFKFKYN